MKKVGSGKWNGYGGKSEPTDKSIFHTACRELFEETGNGIVALPEDLIPKCEVDFFFYDNNTDVADWSVVFFLVKKFSGSAS